MSTQNLIISLCKVGSPPYNESFNIFYLFFINGNMFIINDLRYLRFKSIASYVVLQCSQQYSQQKLHLFVIFAITV